MKEYADVQDLVDIFEDGPRRLAAIGQRLIEEQVYDPGRPYLDKDLEEEFKDSLSTGRINLAE